MNAKKQTRRERALSRFTRRSFQDWKHPNETQKEYEEYLKRKQQEFLALGGKL